MGGIGAVSYTHLDVYKRQALVGVFDPANFIQCGQDTWEAWELLASRTYYMHIKDALADGKVCPRATALVR